MVRCGAVAVIPESIPVKLKTQVLDQIDQILTIIGSSELAAVTLLSKFVEGHIATPVVLDVLSQIEDVVLQWQPIAAITECDLSDTPLLFLNANGDSFLVAEQKGDQYHLQYGHNEDEIEAFWATED